jgi:hypothetical protein
MPALALSPPDFIPRGTASGKLLRIWHGAYRIQRGADSAKGTTSPSTANRVAPMISDDWSDHENDAVVSAWFSMLTDELAEQAYNKAAQNRALQELLGRSRGTIEFKLCNVSAAARGFGLPIIDGYKPRFNFQMTLAEAISRWLVRHPDWQAFKADLSRSLK